jgi:CDGSH-type Zn-finger protein
MTNPFIAAKHPNVLELDPGTYYWCACGKSKDGTFCDGSHKDTAFTPKEFEIKERQKVALCQCKNTANSPFCDGAHKVL